MVMYVVSTGGSCVVRSVLSRVHAQDDETPIALFTHAVFQPVPVFH